MSGLSLEYSLSDFDQLQPRMAQLAKMDTVDLMDSISETIEEQTTRRLKEGKNAPDGTPWEPLTDEYKARKAKTSSGGILEFEGDLIDSITPDSDSDTAEVSSNLIYAAIQQLGGEPVDINIPARPYFGFSDENILDLSYLVNDFVDDHVDQVMRP